MSGTPSSVVLGIAGASRNAALALSVNGRIVGVCEHERVIRTRRAALGRGRLPAETLQATLEMAGCREADITVYAAGEAAIELPHGRPVVYLDHHEAHAATAFYTSPFRDATILICDRHSIPELTVWRGDEHGITQEDFTWMGPAFANVYAQAAEAFGFAREGDEHRLEALARVGERGCSGAMPPVAYRENHLDVSRHFQASIAGLAGGPEATLPQRAAVAERVQRHLGELLLELARTIHRRFGGRHLCLGGGLFFNSYFNTLLTESGLYEGTFVPANPGNAGVAVGAALLAARRDTPLAGNHSLSPFLGPEYGPDDVKATFDNCKLSYDYLRNGQLIAQTTTALTRGQLVGWFQGRMEWGPRALGNRSILASPVAPYVLENLNVFLKGREPHRSYSVAICAEDLPRYFRGPASSPFMEYEYEVLDRELLRPLLPGNATKLRVQTVDESAGAFYELIRAFRDVTGVPMLVNTSFNGFNEPIVCTPRDAVRVFYGTGLDMVVIGSLVLRK
jgi:carbamoyltransferase